MPRAKQIKFSDEASSLNRRSPSSQEKSVHSQSEHELVDWVPDDLGECLERLFDPLDFSYLPMDEQLKKFKCRDLRDIKLFLTAQACYGKYPIRKRVFKAE